VPREHVLELLPAGLVFEQDVIAALDAHELTAGNLAGDARRAARIDDLIVRDLDDQRRNADLLQALEHAQLGEHLHEATGDFLRRHLPLQLCVPLSRLRRRLRHEQVREHRGERHVVLTPACDNQLLHQLPLLRARAGAVAPAGHQRRI
jgi:hypothetical protein